MLLCTIIISCTGNKKTNSGTNEDIIGKQWKLIEIVGETIEFDKLRSEPYIFLSNKDNRIRANDGCNWTDGTYNLDAAKSHISFSMSGIYTEMWCKYQVSIEIIAKADNYTLSPDKKRLRLNKGNNPLARFETE